MKIEKKPTVTCIHCHRTFQKKIEGAAVNRNYYRCAECLAGLRKRRKFRLAFS